MPAPEPEGAGQSAATYDYPATFQTCGVAVSTLYAYFLMAEFHAQLVQLRLVVVGQSSANKIGVLLAAAVNIILANYASQGLALIKRSSAGYAANHWDSVDNGHILVGTGLRILTHLNG